MTGVTPRESVPLRASSPSVLASYRWAAGVNDSIRQGAIDLAPLRMKQHREPFEGAGDGARRLCGARSAGARSVGLGGGAAGRSELIEQMERKHLAHAHALTWTRALGQKNGAHQVLEEQAAEGRVQRRRYLR